MARVVIPRAQLTAVRSGQTAVQAQRPAALRSEFVGTSVSSLCSSIAGVAISTATAVSVSVRGMFVEANAKKSIGCTKEGTNRKAARTSGFRTRNKTKNGKKINKARRAKGRANIAPASKGSGKHR